ncbi:hypothetical protein ENINMM101M1_08480 [Enterobacter intestinihominis]
MYPTLSQVIEVVRQSSGHHRKRIDVNTLIEATLISAAWMAMP